jgi:hypothetical protein
MAGAAVVNGFGKAADLQAFIEDDLGFPKHLARRVHELYFGPVHEEFQARTMWSLSNAFTSAFKELEPIPQYKATAKLAGFLQRFGLHSAHRKHRRTVPRSCRLSRPIANAGAARGPHAAGQRAGINTSLAGELTPSK